MADVEFELDQDAVDAALELFGRAGGRESQFGHTDPDQLGPGEHVTWYAWVQFHSNDRVMVQGKSGPVEALEALARRLLNGAKCAYCVGTVTLSGKPQRGVCRWTRQGAKWVRGCEATYSEKTLRIASKDFKPGATT